MPQTPQRYIETVWLLPRNHFEETDCEVISRGSNDVLRIERRQNGDIWVEKAPIERTRGDSDCRYVHRHWKLYPCHRIASIKYVEKTGRHDCCGK